jgi:hypothetical protein
MTCRRRPLRRRRSGFSCLERPITDHGRQRKRPRAHTPPMAILVAAGLVIAVSLSMLMPVRVRVECSGAGRQWRLFGAVALGPWWAWHRSWALSLQILGPPRRGRRGAIDWGAAARSLARRMVLEAAWLEGSCGAGNAAATAVAVGAAAALFYGALTAFDVDGPVGCCVAPCWQRRVVTGSLGGIGRLRVGDIMAASIEGVLAGRRTAHGGNRSWGRAAWTQRGPAGGALGGRTGLAPH